MVVEPPNMPMMMAPSEVVDEDDVVELLGVVVTDVMLSVLANSRPSVQSASFLHALD